MWPSTHVEAGAHAPDAHVDPATQSSFEAQVVLQTALLGSHSRKFGHTVGGPTTHVPWPSHEPLVC